MKVSVICFLDEDFPNLFCPIGEEDSTIEYFELEDQKMLIYQDEISQEFYDSLPEWEI